MDSLRSHVIAPHPNEPNDGRTDHGDRPPHAYPRPDHLAAGPQSEDPANPSDASEEHTYRFAPPSGPQQPPGPPAGPPAYRTPTGGQYPHTPGTGPQGGAAQRPTWQGPGQGPSQGQGPQPPQGGPTGGQQPPQPGGAPYGAPAGHGGPTGGRPAYPGGPTGGQQAPGYGAPTGGQPSGTAWHPEQPGGPGQAQGQGPVQGQGPGPNPPSGGPWQQGGPAGGPRALGAGPGTPTAATGPRQSPTPTGGQWPPQGGPAPSGPQQSQSGPYAPPRPPGPERPSWHGQGPPQQPTGGQQPLQGRVMPPGGAPQGGAPGGARPGPEPGYPFDANAATQNISAVDPDSTQNISAIGDDEFGGLQMFRDDSRRPGVQDTAAIDTSGLDDFEDHRSRHGGGTANRRRLMLIGGFVALVLVGGIGAFLFATSGGAGGYDVAKVADESTDSGALSIEEVFPDKEIELNGETYSLVNTDETEKCATVANGGFGAALTDNDCRQVVRASFVNEDKSHAVTIGVAAMSSAEKATAAEEAVDLKKAGWFAGLRGKEGSGGERLDTAGGHASGSRWGRYLLFALAANSDGRAPKGGDDALAAAGDEAVALPLETLGERAKP